MKHHDVAEIDLVEMHRFGHRASGLVHEGARQQQQRAVAADHAFHRNALKLAAPRRDIVTAGNRLHRHEADVVTIGAVTFTGIAEADEKQHGVTGFAVSVLGETRPG